MQRIRTVVRPEYFLRHPARVQLNRLNRFSVRPDEGHGGMVEEPEEASNGPFGFFGPDSRQKNGRNERSGVRR